MTIHSPAFPAAAERLVNSQPLSTEIHPVPSPSGTNKKSNGNSIAAPSGVEPASGLVKEFSSTARQMSAWAAGGSGVLE
jgi:hypothetical protein